MSKLEEIEQEWDECICKECGYVWHASETEHFNFTCCEACLSDNIGGEFHKSED